MAKDSDDDDDDDDDKDDDEPEVPMHHDKNSKMVIGFATLAWVLQVAAFATPFWYFDEDIRVPMYAVSRGWGLLMVRGMSWMFHHDVANFACNAADSLTVGDGCGSPMCKWYALKCSEYTNLFVYSYGISVIYLITLIMHAMAIVWTVMISQHNLKRASCNWFLCTVQYVLCFGGWYYFISTMFFNLSAQAVYPEPGFGYSAYAAGIADILMALTWFKARSLGSDDDDDSSEGSSDDEFLKGHKQAHANHAKGKSAPKGKAKAKGKAQAGQPAAKGKAAPKPKPKAKA